MSDPTPDAYETALGVLRYLHSTRDKRIVYTSNYRAPEAMWSYRGKDFFVFPLGAVPKPHAPDVMRPTSDHTRTGFNAATVLGILGHSLDSVQRESQKF